MFHASALRRKTFMTVMIIFVFGIPNLYSETPADTLAIRMKGNIYGKVVDKESKQPIPNVSVQIIGSTAGAATDLEGKFTIKNIAEDIYKLRYTSVGYLPHIETDVRVIRGKTTAVREISLSETAVTGETVEVTAGAFSGDVTSPVTNYSYSREEIRRSPGAAGDIFRAIETLPGVASSGGEFSAFSVRGGSPRDNIVVVDNIPFDKVSHFDGGTEEQEAQGGRFSIFTPGVIDEANFQAGGFSAKYGGKNASFVDLKIKEGNKESITMNGTYDVLGWEVNYDGPSGIHRNTAVLFSARHQNFKTILDMTGQSDLGYPSFTDVLFKSTTEIDQRHSVSILGLYSPEFFERTIDNVYEIDTKQYDNQLAEVNDAKYLLGMNWRYLTGINSVLENTVYYRGNTQEFSRSQSYVYEVNGVLPTPDRAAVRNKYFRTDNVENEYGIKSQFTYSPDIRSTITTGIQIQRISVDYTTVQDGPDTLYTFDANDYRPDVSKKFVILDPLFMNNTFGAEKSAAAAFIDYHFSLTDHVSVLPGVRAEYNGFNGTTTLSPRLSAAVTVTERLTLRAATGVYYQQPELRIISFDGRNALLENERAVHYIFGMTAYLADDVKLTTEVYQKTLNDLIIKSDRTSQRRSNNGSGFARGIDFGLVKKFVDKWYGQVNYSYSVSRRNDNLGGGEYASDFDQPHIFNILFGYEFDNEWSFSTKWKYATGRPKDSYVVHADIFGNPNYLRYSKEIVGENDQRLPDFHTWNIRVDYRKQFGDLAVVAFLDILNLYSRLNVNEERFIETTGTIDPKGFEILPSFGLKLEW